MISDEDLIRISKGLSPDTKVHVNPGHVAVLRRVFDEAFIQGHMAAQGEKELDEEDETIARDRAHHSRMSVTPPNLQFYSTGTTTTNRFTWP